MRTKLTSAAESEGTVWLWGGLKKYKMQKDTGSEKRRKLVCVCYSTVMVL